MDIELAVNLSKKILAKTRSKRTLWEYRKVISLLGKQTPQEYRKTAAQNNKPISQSRYRTLKAAYQFELATLVSVYSDYADILQKRNEIEKNQAYIQLTLKAAEQLAAQKPDYERLRYRKKLGQAHPAPEIPISKTKNSKRKYLGELQKAFPDREWQKKILKEIPAQHYESFCLMALTGLRPEELRKGVFLQIERGKLHVEINGAKVTKWSGQPLRKMDFNPDKDFFAKIVFENLQDYEGVDFWQSTVCHQALYKSHSRAVRRALGPEWVKKVSPYTHRHAMSADLKAAGYSREDIALAMGHVSDRSQKFYGRAKNGCDGRGLEFVEAEREIKQTESIANQMRDIFYSSEPE